jgi:hypothetical protein
MLTAAASKNPDSDANFMVPATWLMVMLRLVPEVVELMTNPRFASVDAPPAAGGYRRANADPPRMVYVAAVWNDSNPVPTGMRPRPSTLLTPPELAVQMDPTAPLKSSDTVCPGVTVTGLIIRVKPLAI